jgi:DNA-binding transcriptional ArsR family regulator
MYFYHQLEVNVYRHFIFNLYIFITTMARPLAHDDAFQAIASPVRRSLLDKLSNREQTVRSLAESFDLTLPAISQQLAILKRAGLVTARRAGRWRVYRLNAEPLRGVGRWLETYQRFWTSRLKALGEDLKRFEKQEERWR